MIPPPSVHLCGSPRQSCLLRVLPSSTEAPTSITMKQVPKPDSDRFRQPRGSLCAPGGRRPEARRRRGAARGPAPAPPPPPGSAPPQPPRPGCPPRPPPQPLPRPRLPRGVTGKGSAGAGKRAEKGEVIRAAGGRVGHGGSFGFCGNGRRTGVQGAAEEKRSPERRLRGRRRGPSAAAASGAHTGRRAARSGGLAGPGRRPPRRERGALGTPTSEGGAASAGPVSPSPSAARSRAVGGSPRSPEMRPREGETRCGRTRDADGADGVSRSLSSGDARSRRLVLSLQLLSDGTAPWKRDTETIRDLRNEVLQDSRPVQVEPEWAEDVFRRWKLYVLDLWKRAHQDFWNVRSGSATCAFLLMEPGAANPMIKRLHLCSES
ncbi:collagen alpha-1(III) chain-like [Choloepus didactylus]|uniref:collagen alpha-1(III) chain-like n=1 Tax=Choloepus didactylus TaxID=27675 RepID=UPI0018A00399|nr:collagen alpha-1(III) chain-like [Choloepus didactylus]